MITQIEWTNLIKNNIQVFYIAIGIQNNQVNTVFEWETNIPYTATCNYFNNVSRLIVSHIGLYRTIKYSIFNNN